MAQVPVLRDRRSGLGGYSLSQQLCWLGFSSAIASSLIPGNQGVSSPVRWLGVILTMQRAPFQHARARIGASVLC